MDRTQVMRVGGRRRPLPFGARPLTSGFMEAPLEAVATMIEAPPRSRRAAPGSVLVLSMYSWTPSSRASASRRRW
ncbi:hypothetical protein ACIBP6_19410 [Nonomuraea terrae]|uniref:hypothetical protein n=1 Tax=Nonomuraea terrae TaxID=2530383 RepID=UPI0037A87BB6